MQMKKHRILACLLAVCMVFGLLVSSSALSVFAADEKEAEEDEVKTIQYTVQKFNTAEEKLATMTLFYEKENYQLYADHVSGEVAMKDKATGNVLFTNPYDMAFSTATASQKEELLSQLRVSYTKITTAEQVTMNSYASAALLGQISVKAIRGGIRVEYTIGQTAKRKILPRWIEASRFEELILSKFEDGSGDRMKKNAKSKIEHFYSKCSYKTATSAVEWAG
ncbi:MAG TPA: hypothetical protein DCY74_04570, partial [Clostridiales bacterium]|nr:hypothetical protein [Clostridiales bacterium]